MKLQFILVIFIVCSGNLYRGRVGEFTSLNFKVPVGYLQQLGSFA